MKIRQWEGRYTVKRWAGGIMAGLHGIVCYEGGPDGGEEFSQMSGLDPQDILGRELGDGAIIEVTVRVVREGKVKHNPWLKPDGTPNYGTSQAAVTAKTCQLCHPPKRRKTKST